MRNENTQQFEKYFHSVFSSKDPWLDKAKKAAAGLKLGHISLGDAERAILQTVIHSHGCRKFIEIGTLTGASGLAILAGMPMGSRLWTFEKEPQHAELAEPILKKAAEERGLECEIVLGDAQMRLFEVEEKGPFDGIFIDGNKTAYMDYLKWAEKNIQEGGLIVADNVFLDGGVFGEPTEKFSDKQISIMQEFNKRLFDKTRYQSCLIPTQEGLLVSVKLF
jgi:predicted O-methyltransferase YrrM